MQTDISRDELKSFHEFLGRRIENGGTELTPEDSVREFRLYQEELKRFLVESKPAFEQARRNEGHPLDVDALMERVTKRSAEETSTN